MNIPILADLYGFKSEVIWDNGSKSDPTIQKDLFNLIRKDIPVMLVGNNLNGELHARTIVRMELWQNSSTMSVPTFKAFVMDPAHGTTYQVPPVFFTVSNFIYKIYK